MLTPDEERTLDVLEAVENDTPALIDMPDFADAGYVRLSEWWTWELTPEGRAELDRLRTKKGADDV